MAINKVKYGNTTLIDLTGTTATADKILTGYGAYGKDGVWMDGSATAGGGVESVTQDQNGYVILDDDEGTQIVVDPLSVTSNGTYTATTGHAYSPVTVNVPTGGGSSAAKKQISFIDYDGTILHSYTASEWASITVLPSNPTHTGLISQGWNWTKAQIDTQLSDSPDGDIFVGQMYITQSGDTEIDVHFENRLSPVLAICVNGTVTVDWGDNTVADTVSGSSLTTTLRTSHTYNNSGDYTIAIHVVSGTMSLYMNATMYTLLCDNVSIASSYVYANAIQAIRIGNNVTTIGTYAFQYSYSLTSITIPSSVTTISSYAFRSCYSLISITVPSSVTTLSDSYIFSDCNSLKNIAAPRITGIGLYVFQNCYSITNITIPSSLTTIGNYAFYNCRLLTNIQIPNSVTSIGSYSFYNCHAITDITTPSSVSNIGNYAFYSCTALTSISISGSISQLTDHVFGACSSLLNIEIPSDLPKISTYAFYNCRSLMHIQIPNTVTSIGSYAFSGCNSLLNVEIPSGITKIDSYTFEKCNCLTSLTIPSGVTSIGNMAFSACYGMAEYHFLHTTPPTLSNSNAFSNISSDCIIYVPVGCLEAYQTATNWATYAAQMQEEPQ